MHDVRPLFSHMEYDINEAFQILFPAWGSPTLDPEYICLALLILGLTSDDKPSPRTLILLLRRVLISALGSLLHSSPQSGMQTRSTASALLLTWIGQVCHLGMGKSRVGVVH